MNPKLIVSIVVLFLHNLFTVVWIGGLITLGLTVFPTAKARLGRSRARMASMQAIQTRLKPFVYLSIVGLLLTGILLSRRNPQFQGLFGFGSVYETILAIKHFAVIAMVVVTLVRSLGFGGPPGNSSPRPDDSGVAKKGEIPSGGKPNTAVSRRERVSALLLFANIVLGVIVLALSSATTMLG